MSYADGDKYERYYRLEAVATEPEVNERVRYLMQARDICQKIEDIAMKDGVEAAIQWVKENVK